MSKEKEESRGKEMSLAEFQRCKTSHNANSKNVKAVRFGYEEVLFWVMKYSKIGSEFAIRDVVLDDGQASKAMVISNDMGDIIAAFEFGKPCPPFCNTTITGLE